MIKSEPVRIEDDVDLTSYFDLDIILEQSLELVDRLWRELCCTGRHVNSTSSMGGGILVKLYGTPLVVVGGKERIRSCW